MHSRVCASTRYKPNALLSVVCVRYESDCQSFQRHVSECVAVSRQTLYNDPDPDDAHAVRCCSQFVYTLCSSVQKDQSVNKLDVAVPECGDQRRLTGNGSALESVLHDCAIQIHVYFTLQTLFADICNIGEM